MRSGRRGRAAEEAITGFGPDTEAFGIPSRLLPELLAPALALAQRVAFGLKEAYR